MCLTQSVIEEWVWSRYSEVQSQRTKQGWGFSERGRYITLKNSTWMFELQPPVNMTTDMNFTSNPLFLSLDPLFPLQQLRHTCTSSLTKSHNLHSLLSLRQPLMQPNCLLKFACPLHEQGCAWCFWSQAGCTYHIYTCHTDHNVVTPPCGSPNPQTPEPVSPPFHGSNPNTLIPDNDIPCLPSPENSPPHLLDLAWPKKNYHPWMTGKHFFIATYPQPFAFVIYNFQEGLVMNMGNFYLREHHHPPGLTWAQMTGIHLRMRFNS